MSDVNVLATPLPEVRRFPIDRTLQVFSVPARALGVSEVRNLGSAEILRLFALHASNSRGAA